MNSLTQMVVVTEKGNKNSTGFLMTIIPDKDYLEATDFKAFYSSYKSWQKGFSGYIFYHTLGGDFANGWKFADGKIIKTVKQKTGEGIDIGLKSATDYNCSDYYTITWYQDCTDWYTMTEYSNTYNGTTCGASYAEWEYLYSVCSYGGGGGGGYTPPEPEPEPEPCNCNICPFCSGCLNAANSTNCPAPCPGHRNPTFDNAINSVIGLTASSIADGITLAMNEGRITVNSSTSNPIFYVTFTMNAEGKWIYTIAMNPNNLTNLDNGTKMIIAHEMYHFYKIGTGPANQAGANDYHHALMVLDSDYSSMLMEIFPGHDSAYYDMLRFAGTPGSPIFDNLPQAERDAIQQFFIANGFY